MCYYALLISTLSGIVSLISDGFLNFWYPPCIWRWHLHWSSSPMRQGSSNFEFSFIHENKSAVSGVHMEWCMLGFASLECAWRRNMALYKLYPLLLFPLTPSTHRSWSLAFLQLLFGGVCVSSRHGSSLNRHSLTDFEDRVLRWIGWMRHNQLLLTPWERALRYDTIWLQGLRSRLRLPRWLRVIRE